MLYSGSMPELSNLKRIILPKGGQRAFLIEAQKRLNLSWPAIARIAKVCSRTIRSWRSEQYSISLLALNLLRRRSKQSLPRNARIVPAYSQARASGRKGGVAAYRKYGVVGGDPQRRKELWDRWWKTNGKFRSHPIIGRSKAIRFPRKSVALAEWVGIMLGDGGISDYQVTITLNRYDDRAYVGFVSRLTEQLFGVRPRLYPDTASRAVDIVISRVDLVRFCLKELGLVKGNKIRQQIRMPSWIQERSDYAVACVRGVMDTDGSVFTHRYRVNGKWYQYKKLGFTSASVPLLRAVLNILQRHGLRPRLNGQRDIRLESVADVQKYFSLFSSHNPKHLKRYST